MLRDSTTQVKRLQVLQTQNHSTAQPAQPSSPSGPPHLYEQQARQLPHHKVLQGRLQLPLIGPHHAGHARLQGVARAAWHQAVCCSASAWLVPMEVLQVVVKAG